MTALTVRGAQPWQQRHNEAALSPRGPERGVVALADALALYVGTHAVADDPYLQRATTAMLSGFRALLNGPLGRLDGGACDAFVCKLAERAGIEPDSL